MRDFHRLGTRRASAVSPLGMSVHAPLLREGQELFPDWQHPMRGTHNCRCRRNGSAGPGLDPQQKGNDEIASLTTVARIAVIAAAGTGLATVATGVASAIVDSDRTIKRDFAMVVWDH